MEVGNLIVRIYAMMHQEIAFDKLSIVPIMLLIIEAVIYIGYRNKCKNVGIFCFAGRIFKHKLYGLILTGIIFFAFPSLLFTNDMNITNNWLSHLAVVGYFLLVFGIKDLVIGSEGILFGKFVQWKKIIKYEVSEEKNQIVIYYGNSDYPMRIKISFIGRKKEQKGLEILRTCLENHCACRKTAYL